MHLFILTGKTCIMSVCPDPHAQLSPTLLNHCIQFNLIFVSFSYWYTIRLFWIVYGYKQCCSKYPWANILFSVLKHRFLKLEFLKQYDAFPILSCFLSNLPQDSQLTTAHISQRWEQKAIWRATIIKRV